jgi:hypothetical protein
MCGRGNLRICLNSALKKILLSSPIPNLGTENKILFASIINE